MNNKEQPVTWRSREECVKQKEQPRRNELGGMEEANMVEHGGGRGRGGI